MVTYLYWIFVLLVSGGAFYLLGMRLKLWMPALVVSGLIVLVCGLFYFFYLEQMFVKRWGGAMSLSVPAGQRHILSTWKDDNLWIENYDPASNTCIFQEYSRGNMLEGKVILKDCNPLNTR